MSTNDTYIFLDTCSLLISCWDIARDDTVSYNAEKDRQFWQTEIATLASAGSIILTKRNYDELIKLSDVNSDPSRPILGKRAKHVLTRIAPLLRNDIVSIVGDPNDPFADAILLSVALKFRTQKNMLFLTQDRALATDLVAISNFQSVRPRKNRELKVRRLNKAGVIERWNLNKKRNTFTEKKTKSRQGTNPTPSTLSQLQNPEKEWWE